mgnify:CR=1 FL=1|tara:strand:+ start:1264 stop:1818 length:555 start_codon:yes stop_codon:yes gene_type:complete
MRKSLNKILSKKINKWIIYYTFLFIVLILGATLSVAVSASELVHKFGNPSFSGIGQSAHYLTIDEQERTRREKIYEDAQDALEEAEREADNTVLAKFIRNLESRIYSTLAKDISESLFNYGTVPTRDNPVMGSINLEGNVLTWINDGVTITLIIEEYVDGVLVSTTEIVIPVGNFGGCWIDCDD